MAVTIGVIQNPQNETVKCVLVGLRNPDSLKENVIGLTNSMPVDIYQVVNEITRSVKEILGPHIDYYESPSNNRTTF